VAAVAARTGGGAAHRTPAHTGRGKGMGAGSAGAEWRNRAGRARKE